MSLRGSAAVVGVAELKPSRWTDNVTTIDLFTQVGLAALHKAN